jgi:hypothetical protein
MQTDALLYRLFQERPATLFEAAGLAGEATGYRLTAIEVKETAFRLDGVLLPPEETPPDQPVLFLENQFQALDSFYPRWLAAIFLYLYREAVERPSVWRGASGSGSKSNRVPTDPDPDPDLKLPPSPSHRRATEAVRLLSLGAFYALPAPARACERRGAAPYRARSSYQTAPGAIR